MHVTVTAHTCSVQHAQHDMVSAGAAEAFNSFCQRCRVWETSFLQPEHSYIVCAAAARPLLDCLHAELQRLRSTVQATAAWPAARQGTAFAVGVCSRCCPALVKVPQLLQLLVQLSLGCVLQDEVHLLLQDIVSTAASTESLHAILTKTQPESASCNTTSRRQLQLLGGLGVQLLMQAAVQLHCVLQVHWLVITYLVIEVAIQAQDVDMP